jgi:hemoglobin
MVLFQLWSQILNTHLQDLEAIRQQRIHHLNSMSGMGIDEAFISGLVEEFYTRVRGDERLGPIFDRVIGDNWEIHLTKMKSFWSTIILKSNTYSGKPVPAHQNLSGVRQGDFDHWLTLFSQTLNDLSSQPEVVEVFMSKARTMASRLESVTTLVAED